MAGVELATAYVSIVPSAVGLKSALSREMSAAGSSSSARSAGNKAGSGFMSGFGSRLKGIAGMLGVALGGAALFSFFKSGIAAAQNFRRINALTAAAIKSTGGAAGVTAKDVLNLAGSISKQDAVTRGSVVSIENMLLRFREIKNVGADKIFDQATQAVVNLSAATGRDGVSSARMLGRALNDPITGIGALTRAGVAFTGQQKEEIKALAQSGDSLGAQKAILAQVEKSYGGAAKAVATPAQRMAVAWAGFKTYVGTTILPAIDSIGTWATQHLIPSLNQIPGQVKKMWPYVEPIFTAIARSLQMLWTALENVWHAMLPVVALLAGGLVASLRAAAVFLEIAAHAVVSLSNVMRQHAGIVGSVAVAVATMWLAWKGYTIVSAIISTISAKVRQYAVDLTYARNYAVGMATATNLAFGVIGIAVGIATYLWSRNRDAQAKAREEAQKNVQTINDLTQAIIQDNGALGENTRKKIEDALQTSGAVDAAKRLGVSLKILLSAAEGNASAFGRLTLAQQAAQGVGTELSGDWLTMLKSIMDLNGQLGTATTRARDQAAMEGHLGKAMSQSADEAANEAQKITDLTSALDDLMGKAISTAEAQLNLDDVVSRLSQQIVDNGTTLAESTSKGRANQQWLIDQIKAVQQLSDAQLAQNETAETVATGYTNNINALRQHMIAAGFDKAAVDALIASLHATPAEVTSTITANTSGANFALGVTKAKAAALKGPFEIQLRKDSILNAMYAMDSLYYKAGRVIDIFRDFNESWSTFRSQVPSAAWGGLPSGAVPWAAGGQLSTTQWNVVGEKGPELISPSGYVVPLSNNPIDKLRSASSESTSLPGAAEINVYPQPGQSEYEIGRAVARELGWATR